MANTLIKGKFQKGMSGNPKGRPKGKAKTTLIREKLVEALETNAEDVVLAVVEAAKKGDMSAAKIILDRLVPVQKAVLSNEGGRKPVVNINIGNVPNDSKQRIIEVTPIKTEKIIKNGDN